MRRPSRRTITIVASVLAFLILVGAGGALYVQRTLAFAAPPSFDATAVKTATAASECRVVTGAVGGVAIEILDLSTDEVYLADGDNPITREEFADTSVRFPRTKNSERFLLFDDTCFYRSYSAPEDCTGDEECFVFHDLYDHTWVTLTSITGQACVPDPGGCDGDVVEPGHLSVTLLDKCQELTWSGPSIDVLSNGRGDEFVMHATDDGQPDLDAPTLPEGWTLEARSIEEPLTIRPRGDGHCYFPVVRDDTLQSYHQFGYADSEWSTDALIE